MTTPAAIRLPRLTTRASLGVAIGMLVVLLAVTAYLIATQPANAPYGAAVAVLAALATVGVWRSATWLDPTNGTVTWRRWAVRRTTLALRDATVVEVVGSGPQALLRVRGGRVGGHLLLLVLSDQVRRAQSPETLIMLADVLATHTAARTSGTAVGLLRAQAKHMAATADPATSPLARFTSMGLIKAAGGVGAAGGGLGNLG